MKPSPTTVLSTRLHCLWDLYATGFQRMVLGRTLWKIVIIKLIILFGVFKLFFFHDFLGSAFQTDQQRTEHVLGELTRVAESVPGPQGR